MVSKLKHRKRRALLAEVANGATLAFANAERLFAEAKLLASEGSVARALFLHQISLEECGKIELLGAWAVSILANVRVDETKLIKAFANHKAKNSANAYMLEISEVEKIARANKD